MKKKNRKKKKLHIPQCIHCPTFSMSYYVSYGVSRSDFRKAFHYQLKEEIGELSEGSTTFIPEKNIMWIWTRKKDLPNLTHEVFHAVDITLSDRGVRLNSGSCEVYAYQIGMLMRKILEKE